MHSQLVRELQEAKRIKPFDSDDSTEIELLKRQLENKDKQIELLLAKLCEVTCHLSNSTQSRQVLESVCKFLLGENDELRRSINEEHRYKLLELIDKVKLLRSILVGNQDL